MQRSLSVGSDPEPAKPRSGYFSESEDVMKKIEFRKHLSAFVASAVVLFAGPASAETVSAIVPWQGEGQIFPIDVDRLRFLGSVEGIMYVEREDGAMNEAFVRCPIVQDISMSDGKTSATGNCLIIASPDDTVYAELRCEGMRGYCRGEFKLTGGTGRFAGITGSGEMTARSPVHALAQNLSEGTVVQAAIGILRLPALEFSLD